MTAPEPRKKLRLFYSAKEVAAMMDVSVTTFRRMIRRNETLAGQLKKLRWERFNESQVLAIFSALGYPDGFEHYESKLTKIDQN
jgi:transposase